MAANSREIGSDNREIAPNITETAINHPRNASRSPARTATSRYSIISNSEPAIFPLSARPALVILRP